MFGFLRRKPEARASSGVTTTQSAADFLSVLGLDAFAANSSGESVTIDSALGVPAIFAAVNFIAGTLAGLPLKAYAKSDEGPKPGDPWVTNILNGVANGEDLTSSFDWRKHWVEQALTAGRGVTFIERNASGRLLNLWPLDPACLTVRRRDRRKIYEYNDDGRKVIYSAEDVLDLPFMLKGDGLTARSPILSNRETVGMAQAVTKYGGRYFANGGVPPFAVTGNFQSASAMGRARDDLDEAVRSAAKEGRQALMLPVGLEIKSIGGDAEKNQLIEAQRFMVEQIARIFSLPPVFLQDLTHGTFSNTEQQDLHFVKHTLKRWVEQIEKEITLKLFGRGATRYVEFSLDGILRGDFRNRMEGYARGIQTGVLMPNEARALENRPAQEGGGQLFIQGATVPITQAGQMASPQQPGGDQQQGADDAE